MAGAEEDDVVLSLCVLFGDGCERRGVRFPFLFGISPYPLRSGVVHSLTGCNLSTLLLHFRSFHIHA